MLKRTLGILTIWFGIWAWWFYQLEKTGIFEPYPRKATKEYLEWRQKKIIDLLNQKYTHHINNVVWTCTVSLSGKTREKIRITLVCGDRLVMPHISTDEWSDWKFNTRIDSVRVEKSRFWPWKCITMVNEEMEWTTCAKDEEEYTPLSKRG
jgi:hypothetical protein